MRFRGIVGSGLPEVRVGVGMDRTVSGVLTIKYWPINFMAVPTTKEDWEAGEKANIKFRRFKELRPGFVVAAQKEWGEPYPSSNTLRLALRDFPSSASMPAKSAGPRAEGGIPIGRVIKLWPKHLFSGGEAEGQHPRLLVPPENAFPYWSYWIAAECIGYLIERAYRPQEFNYAPPILTQTGVKTLRSLVPGVIRQFDEDQIRFWIDAERTGRTIKCQIQQYQIMPTLNDTWTWFGVPWQGQIQDIKSAYKAKMRMIKEYIKSMIPMGFDPELRFPDAEQDFMRMERFDGWENYGAFLEKYTNEAYLLVMRTRLSQNRYIDEELRPIIQQAEKEGKFRGGGKRKGHRARPPRQMMPIRSEIPGEESQIIRHIPWEPEAPFVPTPDDDDE